MSYTVNVENVSKDVRLIDVEEFFEGFGAVDYSIKNGYALVEFKKREDAEDAVKRLDNRKICGQRVLLDHVEPKKERREEYREEYREERHERRDDRYEERRDDRYEQRDHYEKKDDRYDDRYERRRTAYISDRAGNVFRTERDLQAYRDRSPPSHRDNYRKDDRSRDQEYSRPSGKYKQDKVERTKFSLLCRNLSSTVQWMDLKDLGRRFGEVSYADANKAEHGLGIITFTNRDDMINAFDNMQGADFFGRRLKVEYEFPETTDPDWAGRINNDKKGNRRSRSRSRSVSRSRRSHSRSRSPSMH